MTAVTERKVTTDNLRPARRCSDFDSDCAMVPDHYFCWRGVPETGPADGYCPYLMGMRAIAGEKP